MDDIVLQIEDVTLTLQGTDESEIILEVDGPIVEQTVVGGSVDSINGQTGDVVLDPDDLDDSSTDHKFVTDAEKTKLSNTSGTNTGDQDLSPYFNKSSDDTDDITEGATNKFATTAEKTKLGHINITQGVNLDYLEKATIPNIKRNVITTVHFPGYTATGNTTPTSLATLEADTNTSDLGVLLFYQVTTFFSDVSWSRVQAFLDQGRVVVVNLEPMGTLAEINAGNYDSAFIEFRNKANAYAANNPGLRDRLLVKFLHESNLSVGAYPWVVYDEVNLGETFNKFTTSRATVQTAINNFKTAFERLAGILGNTNFQRIFELGQASFSNANEPLDLFFPNSNSYEIASVNGYNRYGISSYHWSPFGDDLTAWMNAANTVAPDKDKMIGESSSGAAGVINPIGTVANIVSGGTGFPVSTTANIPGSAVTHNGAVAPVLSYTTNSSGVITAVNLVNKGEDITNITIASSFSGGTGANITINLRQTGVSKADWIRDAFEWVKNHSDIKYYGWFLENKPVSPTDFRDWSLNTPASRQAFREGWELVNDRVTTPLVAGKIYPNLFSDPYTNSLTGWDATGSQVGVLSRTTLAINLPVNDRNVTGAIRLTQVDGAIASGIPYNNRLRYALPYWNGIGVWNRGVQPNEVITLEFDALFKPFANNVPNYRAPLIVALEDTITGNYERGPTSLVFLSKQMRRYKVIISNGQFSTGGWFISFMIGAIETRGEFIITNLNARLGNEMYPLGTELSDGDKVDITVSNTGGTFTVKNDVVTNAKLANVPTGTIKGRTSASIGDPEDLSPAQVRTLLNVADGAEVNVNPDWDAVSGDAQILNKPIIPTQYTDELAQDAVGGILTDSTSIDLIYDDVANTITAQREALTGAIIAPKNSNTTSLGSFSVEELNTALSDGDIATGGGSATGTNTGDQTSIAGIEGTKSQFNTALTDGNFLYSGDVELGAEVNRTLRNGFYVENDYITTVNTGTFLSQGTGTITLAPVIDNKGIGLANLNTGSGATNSQGSWSSNIDVLYFDLNSIWTYEAKIRLPILSDGTERFQILAGFRDVAGAESVDGAYFSYRNDFNGGRFELVTSSNSVRTRVDSGITVSANTWYTLRIVVRDIGGVLTARFFINDTQVGGDVTTNIPSVVARATGYGLHIIKSIGTTSRTLTVDYQEVTGRYTTLR